MTDNIVELLETTLVYIYKCIYTSVYNIRRTVMSKLPSYVRKAKSDYRKNTTTVSITINPRTEPEIYEKITNQENKSGYIKNLIWADLKGGSHGD